MRQTLLIFCVLLALTSFAQDKINLPATLKFGMSLSQFQTTLQKQGYSNGTTNSIDINKYEDFKDIYQLISFSYQSCPLQGTLKPWLFTGFFCENKLEVVRVSFKGKVDYYEVKNIFESKYGSPQKEDIENLKEGGACKVAEWKDGDRLIRLYQNAAEPIVAPYLEYINLSFLEQAKAKKLQTNKAVL